MSTKIDASILEATVGLLRPFCKNLTTDSLRTALLQLNTPQTTTQERPEKPYSRKEVADLLQISMSTVNRYMNDGRLTRINVGPRRVLIAPESVSAMLKGGRHV